MLMFLASIPDYDEELRRLSKLEDMNFGERFSDFLSSIFNISLPEHFSTYLQVFVWVCIIAMVLWLLYKEFYMSELMVSSASDDFDIPTGGLQGTAADADIRGHNFDAELKKALAEKDYALAIRLRYLMSLKTLDKADLINWKEWKTPLMYVAELEEGSETLRQITTTFLYIKYGHYPATEEVYEEVVAEYQKLALLKKGGEE